MLKNSVKSNEVWVKDFLSLPESGTDQSYDLRKVVHNKSNSIEMDVPKKKWITLNKQYSSEGWTSSKISSLPHTLTPWWKLLGNEYDTSENAVSAYIYSDTKSFVTILHQQMCCQRLALACWYGPCYFSMYLIVGIMLLVLIISDLCADDYTLADRLWFRTIHLLVVVMLSLELLIRINAFRMGRIECLMDLLVILLAICALCLYWTASDVYIEEDVNSPKEIFLVARCIINILCMGYLFTKQLQRNFYIRVFMLCSFEDDCHQRGMEDIQIRPPQALSYNTFTSTGICSEDIQEDEKLCVQQAKNSNSKHKHVRWSNL